MSKIIYDRRFYDKQSRGSRRSAQAVVPIILELLEVESVIDFGCGVGGWLSEFLALGVSDVLGLDGDYVDRSALLIPVESFRPTDLSRSVNLERQFDVALSLEVAEHIAPDAADTFVGNIARCAPVVVFSAAIPEQGGRNHVNERWLSYWSRLFSDFGFEPYDLIRPLIYMNDNVEWWYQQNIIVFARRASMDPRHAPVKTDYELDRIHPSMVEAALARPHTGRQAVVAVTRGLRVLAQRVLQKAKAIH